MLCRGRCQWEKISGASVRERVGFTFSACHQTNFGCPYSIKVSFSYLSMPMYIVADGEATLEEKKMTMGGKREGIYSL